MTQNDVSKHDGHTARSEAARARPDGDVATEKERTTNEPMKRPQITSCWGNVSSHEDGMSLLICCQASISNQAAAGVTKSQSDQSFLTRLAGTAEELSPGRCDQACTGGLTAWQLSTCRSEMKTHVQKETCSRVFITASLQSPKLQNSPNAIQQLNGQRKSCLFTCVPRRRAKSGSPGCCLSRALLTRPATAGAWEPALEPDPALCLDCAHNVPCASHLPSFWSSGILMAPGQKTPM